MLDMKPCKFPVPTCAGKAIDDPPLRVGYIKHIDDASG